MDLRAPCLHEDYCTLRAQPDIGRFVSQLTKESFALVLAGGRGIRLKQLTDERAKPACPSAVNSASSTSRYRTA